MPRFRMDQRGGGAGGVLIGTAGPATRHCCRSWYYLSRPQVVRSASRCRPPTRQGTYARAADG
jgi:hypothetical protein